MGVVHLFIEHLLEKIDPRLSVQAVMSQFIIQIEHDRLFQTVLIFF
jgi:hypothetical protein